jgi:hypothetical protein
MDDNNLNRIFAESDCISNKMMLDYLDGNLSGKDKNTVEVHIESCELCKDEFEGLKSMEDKNKLPEIVSLLNTQISKLSTRRRKIALFPQVTAMAAIILLLIGFVWIFFYIIYINPESLRRKELAQLELKEKEEVQKIIDDNKINPNSEIDIPANNPEDKSNQAKVPTKSENIINHPITESNSTEMAINDEMSKDDQNKSVEENITSGVIVNNDIQEDRKKFKQKDTIVNNLAYLSDESEKQINISKSKANKKEQVNISDFQQAMMEFDKKNYKTSLNLFLRVKEDKTNRDELFYYIAQSYQNIGDQKKAIQNYNKVIAIPASIFYEDALWKKSQLQIQTGLKNDAVRSLNKLVNSKGKYSKQASQQIDSLNYK